MAFGLKNTTALVERRRSLRQSVDIAVVARTLTGDRVPLTVEVLSERGFLAATPQLFDKGAALDVTFPTGRAVRVRVVWVEDGKIGCQLATPVDLRDLLKSVDDQRNARTERAGVSPGGARDAYFGRAGERADDPSVRNGTVGDPDPSGDAVRDSVWLDNFGWLAVSAYETMIDVEGAHPRSVLVRCGRRWAFGRLSERGWVDMNESRLGEALDFEPTLWTPVSDDLAIDLAERP